MNQDIHKRRVGTKEAMQHKDDVYDESKFCYLFFIKKHAMDRTLNLVNRKGKPH